MRQPQIENQIGRLKDGNYLVRCDAVSALIEIGDVIAAPALIDALSDMGSFVRVSAQEALVNIGSPAVDFLIKALPSRDSSVRSAIANVLGEIGDAASVPALAELMRDRDRSLRTRASKALGNIGIEAVPALIAMLGDTNENVRHNAISALWSIGDCDALPRKILATSQWPAQRRIDLLDALRDAQYGLMNFTMFYDFPDTEEFCRSVLDENDAEVRRGAQTMLNWLHGDRDLLIPARAESTVPPREMLRAIQHGAADLRDDSLLRGTYAPGGE